MPAPPILRFPIRPFNQNFPVWSSFYQIECLASHMKTNWMPRRLGPDGAARPSPSTNISKNLTCNKNQSIVQKYWNYPTFPWMVHFQDSCQIFWQKKLVFHSFWPIFLFLFCLSKGWQARMGDLLHRQKLKATFSIDSGVVGGGAKTPKDKLVFFKL